MPAQTAATRSQRAPAEAQELTRAMLDRLAPPARGRIELRDSKVRGLVVRVTAGGHKSFLAYGWNRSRQMPSRITLGTYARAGDPRPLMTLDKARQLAAVALGRLAQGDDPNAERAVQRQQGRTLREWLVTYIESRPPSKFKPSTARDYTTLLNEALPDWLDKPMQAIDAKMVSTRHRQHSKRSPSRANYFARVLRALFTYASSEVPEGQANPFHPNPVNILRKQRAWNRVPRRKTWLSRAVLPAWWASLDRLEDDIAPAAADASALLRVLLLTGLRATEGRELQWQHIDFAERTLLVPDTKNRDPHLMPLSPTLLNLLQHRYAFRPKPGTYVFPAASDPRQPYPKPTLAKYVRIMVADSGVPFTPHDLRRTFATTAERLDMSMVTIKRLLNHRATEDDVTVGYFGRDITRLRAAMLQINVALLIAAGVASSVDRESII